MALSAQQHLDKILKLEKDIDGYIKRLAKPDITASQKSDFENRLRTRISRLKDSLKSAKFSGAHKLITKEQSAKYDSLIKDHKVFIDEIKTKELEVAEKIKQENQARRDFIKPVNAEVVEESKKDRQQYLDELKLKQNAQEADRAAVQASRTATLDAMKSGDKKDVSAQLESDKPKGFIDTIRISPDKAPKKEDFDTAAEFFQAESDFIQKKGIYDPNNVTHTMESSDFIAGAKNADFIDFAKSKGVKQDPRTGELVDIPPELYDEFKNQIGGAGAVDLPTNPADSEASSSVPSGASLIRDPEDLKGLAEDQIWRDPNSNDIYKLNGSSPDKFSSPDKDTSQDGSEYYFYGADVLDKKANDAAVNWLYNKYFNRDAFDGSNGMPNELANWGAAGGSGTTVRALENYLKSEQIKYGVPPSKKMSDDDISISVEREINGTDPTDPVAPRSSIIPDSVNLNGMTDQQIEDLEAIYLEAKNNQMLLEKVFSSQVITEDDMKKFVEESKEFYTGEGSHYEQAFTRAIEDFEHEVEFQAAERKRALEMEQLKEDLDRKNIRDAFEASGKTFTGEALETLGEESAYETDITGLLQQQESIMQSSTKARFEKGIESFGRQYEEYLGSDQFGNANIPQVGDSNIFVPTGGLTGSLENERDTNIDLKAEDLATQEQEKRLQELVAAEGNN